MPYKIEAWKVGDIWCAKTPDRDTFRHADLASAIGEIFTRVNAAVQHAPSHLINTSVEKIGKFMMENAASCDVSITYRGLETEMELAAKKDPTHPLNLYESLMAGTR